MANSSTPWCAVGVESETDSIPATTVIAQFDGALTTAGGTRVETRRFETSVPSTADAASVGPALNRAANQVALDVASWIGG